MQKGVITADIIHSTQFPVEMKMNLYKRIEEALAQTDEDYGTRSEMYRGDSFQCLVPKVKDTLRVALIIKTYIRSLNPSESVDVTKKRLPGNKTSILSPIWMFDVRMAIGIGEVDFEGLNVATSDGIAYQLSGRALDELKNSRYRFVVKTLDEYEQELEMESKLLDVIINKTTALQCEVIYLKLLGYTEIEIAKRLDIKQSAVNQRSVSGSWNVINEMVEYFEKLYSDGIPDII